jgi:hypothetical protein
MTAKDQLEVDMSIPKESHTEAPSDRVPKQPPEFNEQTSTAHANQTYDLY